MYRPVQPADLDAFHALIVDEHVRRYLMDGEIFSREFCAEAIAASGAHFAHGRVGLFMIDEREGAANIGFTGFHVIQEDVPEPQLVYAFFERHTRAAVAEGRCLSALVPPGVQHAIERVGVYR